MQNKEWWNFSFLLYLVFFLSGFWLIFLYPKGEVLLFVNKNHNFIFDNLFKYITFYGDGIFFVLILIFLLFKKLKYSILFLITGISQGILVYIGKKVIFNGIVRPAKFFDGIEALYFIPGVEVHHYNSFPSGHTATAFSIAILIAIISRKQWIAGLSMILAILAAFSRVYLVQHFFIDIYFGSLIGVFTAVAGYFFLNLINQQNKLIMWEKPVFTYHRVPTSR